MRAYDFFWILSNVTAGERMCGFCLMNVEVRQNDKMRNAVRACDFFWILSNVTAGERKLFFGGLPNGWEKNKQHNAVRACDFFLILSNTAAAGERRFWSD